jgi:hypothetical protein
MARNSKVFSKAFISNFILLILLRIIGRVKELLEKLNIKIIRGRPYHLQTQGLVERANQTFKRRLRAIQRERGFPASHWVELLPELALIINTTTTRTLLGKKTPFEVWFGRKPRWMRPDYLNEEPAGVNNDLLHVDNEEFGDDPVLSEIERQVAEHNR